MHTSLKYAAVALLLALVCATGAFAQQMRFQGRLTGPGPSFTPVTTATSVRFRIYNHPTNTTPVLWEETQVITPAASGVFSTNLGGTVALTGVDFSQTLYLGITVGTDPEMVPRYMLTHTASSFYAVNAGDSDLLDGLDSTAFAQLTGANFTGNVSSTGTFSGNGSGLTDVNALTLGGLGRVGFAELTGAAFTGSVSTTGTFSGDGSGLTGVTASTLGGLPRAGFAELTGATFTGLVSAPGISSTGTVTANTFSGSNFIGNGSGLTNVNAQTLSGNTVSAFALLGAGSNTFSGSLQATTITATTGFVGNVTGNLTGNVTGNLTGDVTGDVSGLSAGFTGLLLGDVTGTQGATVIAPGAVTSAKILDGTITGADLSGGISITTTGDYTGASVSLLDGDLTLGSTGNAAFLQLPDENVSDDTLRTPVAGALRYNSGSSAIEMWNGTAWVPGASYNNGTGLSLVGNTFSVTTGGITNALLAGDAVTSDKILDGTITGADLGGAINITTSGSVTAGSFTGNGAGITGLTAGNITGTVLDAQVENDLTINTTKTIIGGNGLIINSGGVSVTGGSITGNLIGNVTGNISGNSAGFTGPLAGDVTGTQSATVVGFVGGQTAANVASGAQAANNATSTNASNRIVIRDGSGNFAATTVTANLLGNVTGNVTGNLIGNVSGTSAGFSGSVTAGSFIGDGSGLTSLDGAEVTGTVANATNAVNATNATNATSATTAVSFSGPLAGHVTGTQGATVIGTGVITSTMILDGTIDAADLNGAISITTTGNYSGANVTLNNGDLNLAATAGNASFLQLPSETVSDDTLRTPTAVGAMRYNTGSSAVEVWNGAAWVPGAAYTAGTGLTLTGNQFSVSPLGVSNALLAADAVTSNKILDGTIVGADLAANISFTTSGTLQATNLTSNQLTSVDGNFVNIVATNGQFNNLIFTSATIIADLTVGNDLDVGNDGTFGNDLTVQGMLTVVGPSSLSTLGTSGLATLNSLAVTNAASVGSTLDVTGGTTLSSTLSVGGVTSLSSTLGVTGATTLSSTLNVSGNTGLGGDLSLTGAATFGSTLGVTGNTSVGGTLGVTGATTLSDTLGVSGNTSVGGTLGVTGATTLSDTLSVGGITSLSSTLDVTGATTLGNTLGVTGNTSVGGDLGVTGAVLLSSTLGVTGATSLGSTLDVTSDTTVGGTLGVTGNTSLSTVDTSGLATLDSLDVLNDALVQGNLDVDGDFTILGTTTMDSLDVTNDATVGGMLGVTGTLTAGDLVTANNGLTVSAGSVSLPAGEINNAELEFSSISLSYGSGVSGDATVSLGGTLSIQNDGTLSVSGTSDQIDVTAGQNPVVSIAPTYAGQTSIVTLGTITTGTWNGTSIADGFVDNNLTIDGGVIDNTVIGGTTAAAATFTSVTATSFTGGSGAFTLLSSSGGFTSTGNLTSFTAPPATPVATYTGHDFLADVDSSNNVTSRALRVLMTGTGGGTAEVTGAWLESHGDGAITQGVFGQAVYTGGGGGTSIGLDGRARTFIATPHLAIGTAGRADDTQAGSNVGVHAWARNGGKTAGIFAVANATQAEQVTFDGTLPAGLTTAILGFNNDTGANAFGLYVFGENNLVDGNLTVTGTISGTLSGNGSALTALNASNITSGTLDNARLTASVTLLGNTFNGADQLVQLDNSGFLPALNGSALTLLNLGEVRASIEIVNTNNVTIGSTSTFVRITDNGGAGSHTGTVLPTGFGPADAGKVIIVSNEDTNSSVNINAATFSIAAGTQRTFCWDGTDWR